MINIIWLWRMSWRVLRCYKTSVVKSSDLPNSSIKIAFPERNRMDKMLMREYILLISYISAYFAEYQLYQLLY